jgi:ABC-type transport system involved in cytochrome bd biosynthesis fused ATPase/permease subunit
LPLAYFGEKNLSDMTAASLNVENETCIQAGISELIRRKTVLVVAHRMRTVANADKIVILDSLRSPKADIPKNCLPQFYKPFLLSV